MQSLQRQGHQNTFYIYRTHSTYSPCNARGIRTHSIFTEHILHTVPATPGASEHILYLQNTFYIQSLQRQGHQNTFYVYRTHSTYSPCNARGIRMLCVFVFVCVCVCVCTHAHTLWRDCTCNARGMKILTNSVKSDCASLSCGPGSTSRSRLTRSRMSCEEEDTCMSYKEEDTCLARA
jgi:hypothetical protein